MSQPNALQDLPLKLMESIVDDANQTAMLAAWGDKPIDNEYRFKPIHLANFLALHQAKLPVHSESEREMFEVWFKATNTAQHMVVKMDELLKWDEQLNWYYTPWVNKYFVAWFARGAINFTELLKTHHLFEHNKPVGWFIKGLDKQDSIQWHYTQHSYDFELATQLGLEIEARYQYPPVLSDRAILDNTKLSFNWVADGDNNGHPVWRLNAYGFGAKIYNANDNGLWSALLDGSGQREIASEELAKQSIEAKIIASLQSAADEADKLRALITQSSYVKAAPAQEKMTLDDKLSKFIALCQSEQVLKKVNFPLGIVEINGKFARFMDSDTDSAWLGFQIGLYAANPDNS